MQMKCKEEFGNSNQQMQFKEKSEVFIKKLFDVKIPG